MAGLEALDFVLEFLPDAYTPHLSLEQTVKAVLGAAATVGFGAGVATDETIRAITSNDKVQELHKQLTSDNEDMTTGLSFVEGTKEDLVTPEFTDKFSNMNISPEDTITKRLSFSNLPDSDQDEIMTEANPHRRNPATMSTAVYKSGDPRNSTSETEPSNIPLYASLSTPFSDTVQVVMPYYSFTTAGSIPSGTTGNLQSYAIRLNTPYDCILDTALVFTSDATPATAPSADAQEATINSAMWYNYYKQLYNYYTVIQADITVRFRNTTNSKNGELAVYRYLHGREIPRYYESGSTAIHHRYKRLHPNISWKFLQSNGGVTELTAVGVKNEPYYDNWVEFSNIIKPGDIEHEVAEDELLEVWSLFDKVPATPEYMSFHIQRSPRSADVTMTYDIEVDVKYYVQFKDLKNTYRYPTASTSFAATTNAAMQDD